MSETSSSLPLCLSLCRADGWDIINYDASERVRVRVRTVLALSQDAFYEKVHRLQSRADDLCVLHLPFGGDARVFQVVDELIADAFDLPSRFFIAEYEEGMAYGARQHVGGAEAADQVLNALPIGHGRAISRSHWLAIKDRQAVARLTIARQASQERKAA